MTKARIVEEIVALLHENEGVTVQRNVLLPSISDPDEEREIDVLITGNVAGYEVRIPIECKNYGPLVSKDEIAIYQDKLGDVGLSVRNSIFVCVSGYDRNARRRAADYGINLFILEGLTEDRLKSIVYKAFMSNVYMLLQVERVATIPRNDLLDKTVWSLMFIKSPGETYRGGLWDAISSLRQRGAIPMELGRRDLVILPPEGWSWHLTEPEYPQQVFVTVNVIGLVLTAEGEANRHFLQNVLEKRYDRAHIRANFADNPELSVTVVTTDDELEAAIHPGGIASIAFAPERAPRIQVLSKLYWPPTERAWNIMKQYQKKQMMLSQWETDSLKVLTFEEIEGTDVSAIWAAGWTGHRFNGEGFWPVRFPTGLHP